MAMRFAPLFAAASLQLAAALAVPSANPQGIANQFWSWRGQQIRYQALGDPAAKQSVLLVHGLFVNADHWRRNVPALAEAGFRVYSIDLLGYGYSSKPDPYGEVAKGLNGENGRMLADVETELWSPLSLGGTRVAAVAQGHPLGSCYNFFTWSEQLCEFVDEVVGKDGVTLVCNSIGAISGLQAAVDRPELFAGVAVVNPNFRELHVAEQPAPLVPVVTAVQSLLRRYGKPLFDSLAKPPTVKQILKEPYADAEQVTDELVDVLLTPLLTEGSAEVVFDTLSYSAGPLPEQLLADPRLQAPVWVCWGEEDPWTPSGRVRSLERFPSVKRVTPLPGVGHCPHDEAPELVNPLLADFITSLAKPDESRKAVA